MERDQTAVALAASPIRERRRALQIARWIETNAAPNAIHARLDLDRRLHRGRSDILKKRENAARREIVAFPLIEPEQAARLAGVDLDRTR